MDRMLDKLAKQLCAYDQMSLSQLWTKYEAKVRAFEPTKEWEEAMVAFCLIQAIRMKNQLFNYHLAASASLHKGEAPSIATPKIRLFGEINKEREEESKKKTVHKATLLKFPSNNKK